MHLSLSQLDIYIINFLREDSKYNFLKNSSWYKHFRDMLMTKYLNISLQFYLCTTVVSINTVKMKHLCILSELWWWKAVVMSYSLIENNCLQIPFWKAFFILYYEKKGFLKSVWLFLFFLTLLKCDCKLISDVKFVVPLRLVCFFLLHWPAHGLCHFHDPTDQKAFKEKMLCSGTCDW